MGNTPSEPTDGSGQSHRPPSPSLRRLRQAVRTGERVEPPPNVEPITREDVTRNDLSVKTSPAHLFGVENFLPELRNKEPWQILQILNQRFAKNPTAGNAVLLEHVVNRIAAAGPVDSRTRVQIAKATEVFRKTDDISYWAYADANFGGASIYADLPLLPPEIAWIYLATSYVGDTFNDQLSSLKIQCTNGEVGGNVILFENTNFVGKYLNYALTAPASLNVGYVGDDFNDITSSILIVRRFAYEVVLPMSTLLPPGLLELDLFNLTIDLPTLAGGLQAEQAGPITITWDMWPTGPTSATDWHPSDPNKRFVYVILPLNMTLQGTTGSFTTYAEARYWIYLYVDGNGSTQGYVDWMYANVPNDPVGFGRCLLKSMQASVGVFNSHVSSGLILLNAMAAPFLTVYLLPGTNALSGNTSDDVTVVCVRDSQFWPPIIAQSGIETRQLTFQPIEPSNTNIFVLDIDGNLWLETGPFGSQFPPPRIPVDANVGAFQAVYVDGTLYAFVLGSDGNLWFEMQPFGSQIPPARLPVDGNVAAFQAVVSGYGNGVFVVGTDGKLWSEQWPTGDVLQMIATRQLIDDGVQAFQAVDINDVVILRGNGDLWWAGVPWGSPGRQIDANVDSFQMIDGYNVFVLGTDGKLWLETWPLPPPNSPGYYAWGNVQETINNRKQVDANVAAFQAIDVNTVFVLGTDGNLWLETSPWGDVTQTINTRTSVDTNSIVAFYVWTVVDYPGTTTTYVVLVKDNDHVLWYDLPPTLNSTGWSRIKVDDNVM